MGKKLQNELWASKLSKRWPLTFFSPSGHGKLAKTLFFFRISAKYSNAKNFKRYPGMPYESWRPAGLKMWWFLLLWFFEPFLLKVNGVWNLEFVNKYGYNFLFQVLPFNQPQNIPIGPILIEYGSIKLKIECISIFLTPQFWKQNSWDLIRLWAAINPVWKIIA